MERIFIFLNYCKNDFQIFGSALESWDDFLKKAVKRYLLKHTGQTVMIVWDDKNSDVKIDDFDKF